MLLGIPLAVLTTRFVIAGRDVLATLAVLALVSPPFIGAYAWIMMLGSNGWMRALLEEIGIELPSIYGMFGILLVFSLKFYPFVFLLTASGLGDDQSVGRGSGGEPRRRPVAPLLQGDAAARLSGGERGRAAHLRAVDRRLRHARRSSAATCACSRPPRSTCSPPRWAAIPGLASATSVVLIAAVAWSVVVLQRWAVRRRDVAGSLIRTAGAEAAAARSRRPPRMSSATRSCSRARCRRWSSSTRRSARPADRCSTRASASTATRASCAKCRTSSPTASPTATAAVVLIVIVGHA